MKERQASTKLIRCFRKIFSLFVFLTLGLCILLILQKIFIPKMYFPESIIKTPDTRIISDFYREEKNTISIIALGTSHLEYAVYPMEIYEDYGLTCYNLATSAQPIEASLYLLKDSLKNQEAKVVILDVSSLFFTSSENGALWSVFNSMPLSMNKIEFANELLIVNDTADVLDKFFPLFHNHSRWNNLQERDFTDFFRNRHLYSKGGNINTVRNSSGINVDTMNGIVDELKERNERYERKYVNGEFSEVSGYNSLYESIISEKNISILFEMKRLCEENGTKLLLVKVPIIGEPNYYESSWTLQRSEVVKQLCREHDIDFFDLLYDADSHVEWFNDSVDGGRHLNYSGAVKISSILGEYFKKNYDLEEKHLEQWNKDLETYKKVKKIAELQTETDFVQYLNKIVNDYRDKTVYIVASDDMSMGLSEDDVSALRSLGLKADYSTMYKNGYLAVIKDGHAQYEIYSNQFVEYQDRLQNGTRAKLCSKGWYCVSDASIIINDTDYSMKGRGLNIVVYDENIDMVLDSVCFDTFSESHIGYRNGSNTLYYFQQYENYLIEVEDR